MSDLETRTMKRITWRIVPFIIILYFLSFLNRVNVGFAGLTMNHDLGLSSEIFGVGVGIFFIGNILFALPANLVLEYLGARRWIAIMMVIWGIASAAMSLITGPYGFYALRFLVGVGEAGFFPGIILYLSFWFPARYRALVTAIFMAAAPFSNMIGSPISGAIMGMNGFMGITGWQWIYILEALPTVILGVVTFFYLTDKPESAAWLATDERKWLVDEMTAERAGKAHVAKSTVWNAMRDGRVWALGLAYAGTSTGLYAIGVWGPMIIKRSGEGLSFFQLGLVNAIPNVIAVIGMMLWARHSDRTGERRLHVSIACLAAAIGMIVSGLTLSLMILIIGLSIANFGINAAKPPLWSMPTLFLSNSAAAVGIAFINSMGGLIGGSIAPVVIGKLRGMTGDYSLALYFVSGTLFVSAIITYFFGRKDALKNRALSLNQEAS